MTIMQNIIQRYPKMENIDRFDNQISRTVDEVEDFFDSLEEQNILCFRYDYNHGNEDEVTFELFSTN